MPQDLLDAAHAEVFQLAVHLAHFCAELVMLEVEGRRVVLARAVVHPEQAKKATRLADPCH